MGGIFSEGIDLPEDKLIGVIIVGTGLPQVCNEREIVKQYFSGIGSKWYVSMQCVVDWHYNPSFQNFIWQRKLCSCCLIES